MAPAESRCYRFFEPSADDLGKEVQCPNCGGLVRLNSFVVKELDLKRTEP